MSATHEPRCKHGMPIGTDEACPYCPEQSELSATPLLADSFAYSTIEKYEELVGFKVNDAFRAGWMMARTMNSHIASLVESANYEL